jgi:hypothetical protein
MNKIKIKKKENKVAVLFCAHVPRSYLTLLLLFLCASRIHRQCIEQTGRKECQTCMLANKLNSSDASFKEERKSPEMIVLEKVNEIYHYELRANAVLLCRERRKYDLDTSFSDLD